MQKLFLRDKAAGLNVSHYGHPHTIINESDTSSSNHTGTKAVIHKLSGSNKEKGGHEHDQHDEETLKRHIADIEKENAKKKEMESKKIVSKDKKKVHTGNEDAIE